ncbi:MAG: hypothetical protein JXN61_17395 [Sedimentisphaerales bacterium]|nr:hypothetical protein [Sedimentisphaerales bacterium]
MKTNRICVDPDISEALAEVDRLKDELERLLERCRGKPGSVDLARALARVKRLRKMLIASSCDGGDWGTAVEIIACLVQLAARLWPS